MTSLESAETEPRKLTYGERIAAVVDAVSAGGPIDYETVAGLREELDSMLSDRRFVRSFHVDASIEGLPETIDALDVIFAGHPAS